MTSEQKKVYSELYHRISRVIDLNVESAKLQNLLAQENASLEILIIKTVEATIEATNAIPR